MIMNNSKKHMFVLIISDEMIYLTVGKANMTKRFVKIAEKKSIRVLTWLNAKMKEFVD